MHILFISTMEGAPWGGSEELWSQAALRLLEKGHRVSASVYPWPRLAPQLEELRRQGINLHIREANTGAFSSRLRRRVTGDPDTKWLANLKPDLAVISQGGNADGLGWMQLLREGKIPYAPVVQCNAEIWWPGDDEAERLAELYGAAQNVFCVSRHNLELLQRQLGADLPRGRVISNPYRLPNRSSAWPSSVEKFRLACVARLDPTAKGQDILLEVLSLPHWRERPVQVDFYGQGRCVRSLPKLAERLGLKNVQFRGHAADVAGIWKENHLLLLPSRYEGTPLTLIEAMWCGRPAVVTDVGGNSELCLDNVTGFVAPAPTIDLFDAAMERAWVRREDWPVLGEAARQRVETLLPADPIEEFCAQLLPQS
jgi:glycosyltransferase involved in cell wall biosynthesis